MNIFVYGTLREETTQRFVIGRVPESTPAILDGYKKIGLDIIQDMEESVFGDILTDITDEELHRLDIYESVATNLYKRITVYPNGTECIAYQKVDPSTVINKEVE